ncbi:unnamed protein product [Urochloa humidicola]
MHLSSSDRWFIFAAVSVTADIRMKVSIYAPGKKSYTMKEEPTTREIQDYLLAFSDMPLMFVLTVRMTCPRSIQHLMDHMRASLKSNN